MEGRHSSPSHAAPSSRGKRSAGSSSRRVGPAERSARVYEDSPYYDTQPAARQMAETTQRGADAAGRTAAVRSHSDASAPCRPQQSSREEAPRKRRSDSAGKDILIIVAMTVAILLVFAFFHHVRPRMGKVTASEPEQTPAVIKTPEPSPAVQEHTPETTPAPMESEPAAQESEEPEGIDTRTEWQKKFADHFTDEVVSTDSSYTSQNLSVTIETHAEEVNGRWQTWYVADIYVASIDCLRTYFATNEYRAGSCLAEPIEKMCAATSAVFAVSGDYCTNQFSGFLIRNGEVIHDDYVETDVCVLFSDGTVETLSPGDYNPTDLIARGAWQSWKFGPKLLNAAGQAMTEFNTGLAIKIEAAPRCGFGYYEPGHYCLVVNDGRQNHSTGFVLDEFAKLFEDLGCTAAYNLDGGATAVMAFNGKRFSKPSANRDPGDIFYLAEPAPKQEENS